MAKPAQGWAAERHSDAPDVGAGRSGIAYAAFALTIYLGVHLGLNGGGSDELPAVDAMATVNQAIILLCGLALMVRRGRAGLRGLADLWPYLIFLAFAATSFLWSQSPDATLHRSLTLATLILFATYAYTALGAEVVCRIQVAVMWGVAAASMAVAMLVPSSGMDVAEYAGAVRGVFTQKNSLGDAMVVGILALSFVVLRRRRAVWTDLISLLLALAVCRLAQATTSLLLCGLVTCATAVVLLLLEGGAVAAFSIATFVAGAGLLSFAIYALPIDLFAVLGKDSSLTGRVQIWAAVHDVLRERELLGFGYSAFWLPDSHSAQDVWTAIGWTTPSAHNGFLETRLELGLVGLALLSGIAAMTAVSALGAFRSGDPAAAAWAVILLATMAVYNSDESSLPRPDIHLVQWILVFATCSRAWRLRGRPHRADRDSTPAVAAAGRPAIPG